MKLSIYYIYVFIAILLCSCGNPSNDDYWSYSDDNYSIYNADDYEQSNSKESQIVACPLCYGTGIIYYMPGDPMSPRDVCSLCNGLGECDASSAQPVIDMQQDIRDMFHSRVDYNNGQTNAQIENEIEMHERNLSRMEDILQYMDRSISRTQIEQQIINEQYEIRRLKSMLE